MKVTAIIGPVYSRISEALPKEISDKIDLACSYFVPGAEFTPQVKSDLWDGFRRLYSVKTQSFYTGLLSKVENVLKEYNIKIDKIFNYPEINYIDSGKLNLNLYDYQKECLNVLKSNERGVVKLPTGSGKGCIISSVIAERKVRTIVIVHRTDLLYQTKERLKKEIGIDAGIVGDGHADFKDITVAMVQTLCNNLGITRLKKEKFEEEDKTIIYNTKKEILKYNMLISDEVHCLGAKSYFKLSKFFKNAVFRYGFSATPFERDEALLIEAAIGPLIYRKTVDELKDYIASLKLVFVQFTHKKSNKYLTYNEVYNNNIVYNEARNRLIKRLAEKYKNKKTIISVRSIEHGKELKKLIDWAEFIYGGCSSKKRMEVLHEFESGNLNCVIVTNIWEQGIDIPKAEVLIDARAEKSRVSFIQLIGRVLRKTPSKKQALIIDIEDKNIRWLSNHSKERIKTAIEEFGIKCLYRLKEVKNL